jgi:hypothetical protein
MAGIFRRFSYSRSTQSGPGFRAETSVATSVATGASGTKVNFATVGSNVGGYYDSSTSRFTPKIPGWYQFNAVVNNNGVNTDIYPSLKLNGSTKFGYGFVRAAGAGVFTYAGCSGCVYLNGSTDYVEVFMEQYSGSSQNLNNLGYFNGCYVRP